MLRDVLPLINDLPDIIPEVIILEDHEMFHDANGKTLYVNVVGERKCGECYFRVKDLMKAFDMKYLDDVIMNKKKKYQKMFITRYLSNKVLKIRSMVASSKLHCILHIIV